MAPVFRVLRCYQCLVFQVHQAKRSIKWECKLCGEKQSFKRQYGIGSAQDCRLQVQKLNILNGQVNEAVESNNNEADTEDEEDLPPPKPKRAFKSKWKSYVDEVEEQTETENNENYLGDAEVVLEIPKKMSKKSKWQPPTAYNNVDKKLIENNVNYTDENSYLNNIETDIIHCKTKIEEAKKEDLFVPIKPNAQHLKKSTQVSKKENVERVSSEKKYSKWAQYEQEDDDSQPLTLVNIDNTLDAHPEKTVDNIKNQTANIFSLNDDIDLDDFLDF